MYPLLFWLVTLVQAKGKHRLAGKYWSSWWELLRIVTRASNPPERIHEMRIFCESQALGKYPRSTFRREFSLRIKRVYWELERYSLREAHRKRTFFHSPVAFQKSFGTANFLGCTRQVDFDKSRKIASCSRFHARS